jgi:hypothetical protein
MACQARYTKLSELILNRSTTNSYRERVLFRVRVSSKARIRSKVREEEYIKETKGYLLKSKEGLEGEGRGMIIRSTPIKSQSISNQFSITLEIGQIYVA